MPNTEQQNAERDAQREAAGWPPEGVLGAILTDDAIHEIVDQKVTAALADLKIALEEYPGHLRPFALREIIELFPKALDLFSGLEHVEPLKELDKIASKNSVYETEFWAALVALFSDKALCQFLFQIPIVEGVSPGADLRKHFAVDLAEVFGPDWAQAWYRFIVLVTKLV